MEGMSAFWMFLLVSPTRTIQTLALGVVIATYALFRVIIAFVLFHSLLSILSNRWWFIIVK
jgi:hypothetical protein